MKTLRYVFPSAKDIKDPLEPIVLSKRLQGDASSESEINYVNVSMQ
jgi:hypothetical protein